MHVKECAEAMFSFISKGDSAKMFLSFNSSFIHSRKKKRGKGEILVPFSTYLLWIKGLCSQINLLINSV